MGDGPDLTGLAGVVGIEILISVICLVLLIFSRWNEPSDWRLPRAHSAAL